MIYDYTGDFCIKMRNDWWYVESSLTGVLMHYIQNINWYTNNPGAEHDLWMWYILCLYGLATNHRETEAEYNRILKFVVRDKSEGVPIAVYCIGTQRVSVRYGNEETVEWCDLPLDRKLEVASLLFPRPDRRKDYRFINNMYQSSISIEESGLRENMVDKLNEYF